MSYEAKSRKVLLLDEEIMTNSITSSIKQI